MAAAVAGFPTDLTAINNGHVPFTVRNQFAIGLNNPPIPLSSPDSRALWKKDIRMAVFHNNYGGGSDQTAKSDDTLGSFLVACRKDASLLRGPDSARMLAMEIEASLPPLAQNRRRRADIAVTS